MSFISEALAFQPPFWQSLISYQVRNTQFERNLAYSFEAVLRLDSLAVYSLLQRMFD